MSTEHSASEAGSPRFQLLLFGVTSLLSAGLRLLYLLPLRGNPLFDEAHRDSVFYVQRAREILAGDFWGSGVYFHSAPLYPYFLALVMGPAGSTGLWWVRVVQALLSGLTAGLLALFAFRLFGRAAAMATAVMALLYAPFLFYSGELLEITLSLFFLALAAWILAKEELSAPRLLGAGALVAAAALGKPNLLVLLPVILVHQGFLRPLLKPALWPWRKGILLMLGATLVIAPFTLRNRLAGDDWVLISSNGGINLFIGNNPAASGGFQVPTAMQYDLENSSRLVASQALGKVASPSETSRFWAGRAWAFIKARPGEATALLLRKAGLLIGGYEIPNHFNIYFFREYLSPMLRWPLAWFSLVLPLGVLGLIRGARRNRATSLAAASLLTVGATVVLFFVTSRYRLPVLVWLLPFSGLGLVMLVGLVRARRWRLLLLPLALLVGVSALMHLPLVGVKDFHDDFLTLAYYWSEKGDWEKAAMYNQQALRENMKSSQAWQNLGYAYSKRGREEQDMDRAEECFFKALELNPTEAHAYGNLAYLYFVWNRPELFGLCLERALILDPMLETTLADLISLKSVKLSDWRDRAERQLAGIEKKLAANPDDPRQIHERGRVLALRLERHEEGLAVLNSISAEALAADEALAKRQALIIKRIERTQRYRFLLERPLPPGALSPPRPR